MVCSPDHNYILSLTEQIDVKGSPSGGETTGAAETGWS
jgi:hypothetical protein